MKKICRDVAEALIIDKENKILLQKKTLDYPTVPGGHWCFFGGKIEKGENPVNALKRELSEELGTSLDKIKLFQILEYELPIGFYGKRYIFKVIFDKDISDISITEGAGFAFFDKSELKGLNLELSCLESLGEHFNHEY